MKTLFASVLILLAFAGHAQDIFRGIPRDSATGKILYEGVVQVPGATKAELYSRAREWAAVTFKSAKDALQMDDAASGKLIAKGVYLQTYYILATSFSNYYWHTIKIEVKDGRYRYQITDFYIEGSAKMLGTDRSMEAQIATSSKSVGSGAKSGNPKGNYKHHLDGVKIPAETEVASLSAAMTVKSKDF